MQTDRLCKCPIFNLFCNENDAGNSSDVALRFDHFKNHLASISDVNMCASLPYDALNCVNALNLYYFKKEFTRIFILWEKSFSGSKGWGSLFGYDKTR